MCIRLPVDSRPNGLLLKIGASDLARDEKHLVLEGTSKRGQTAVITRAAVNLSLFLSRASSCVFFLQGMNQTWWSSRLIVEIFGLLLRSCSVGYFQYLYNTDSEYALNLVA